MFLIRWLLAPVLAATLGVPFAQPAAYAERCRFVLGFAALHDLLPGVIGQCLDDEQHNPANGDGLQHTTKGLLVWRKADNVTAFTDGYSTIVNGPHGVEYRLNGQRFAWEANPDGLPVVPDAPIGPAQRQQQSGPTLQVTENTLGYARGPLVFKVVGSGFAPGEPVTLRGTYAPSYSLATGDPQSPQHELRCAAVALGPVQATTGSDGGFAATIQASENPHTGGEVRLTATGARSGASATTVEVAPQGITVSAIPPGCVDASGVAGAAPIPSALPPTGAGGR